MHRRHMVSALTLLGCHESESPQRSYGDIADRIRRYGVAERIVADQEELFGRMVFNIFVTNDDDLTFIVREMMGELNGGHVYASATAPRPRGDARNVGLLGADRARSQMERLAAQAAAHLDALGDRADLLRALAQYAIARRN